MYVHVHMWDVKISLQVYNVVISVREEKMQLELRMLFKVTKVAPRRLHAGLDAPLFFV